jgi:hypothetical protein
MKHILFAFIVLGMLAGCGSDDEAAAGQSGGPPDESGIRRNPREAGVAIEGGIVTITIPGTDPQFWLEKVEDDSVQFSRIYFKYEPGAKSFYYRTDLDDWQPVPPGQSSVELGQVRVDIQDRRLTITYPSGTWAFP